MAGCGGTSGGDESGGTDGFASSSGTPAETDEGPGTAATDGADVTTGASDPASSTSWTSSSGDDETGGLDEGEETTPPWFEACEGADGGLVVDADPSNYLALLGTLQPGDTLRLSAGEYTQGLSIHGMQGTEGACFFIEGPSEGASARFVGSSSRNTVSIVDSRFVVVRSLELDGAEELGDAVKAEGTAAFADHIVLEDLYIHDHDATQQVVGINSKCPSWHWVIRGNRIERTGTGMYLGDSDGSAPFVGGLIEHNVVLDTSGYNAQVKHQMPRPTLEGLPQEPRDTIIRHNVFSKSAGAATGDGARPNLLVGHLPLSGPGQDDRYLIYGNFLFDNPTEALLQAEGNVAVYSNVFVNPNGSAVNVQPHNDVPRSVEFHFNTVLASGHGVRMVGGDPAFTQRATGNAVFAEPAIDAPEAVDNYTAAPASAAAVLVAPDALPGEGLDVAPVSSRAVAVSATLPELPNAGLDFDGRGREPAVAGAYSAQSAWPLDLTRKP